MESESDDKEIKMHEVEDESDGNEDESDANEDESDSNDNNDVMNDKSVIKEEGDSDDEEDHSAKHPRRVSNDVSEGKTIFLKNLPFSVKNDELKKCMEQFGPVFYALVCMDPLTEYSRGTAFVKFQVRITILRSCSLILFINFMII